MGLGLVWATGSDLHLDSGLGRGYQQGLSQETGPGST